MATDAVPTRLGQLFAEEASAAVAAAAATAAAAGKELPTPLRAPSNAPSLTYSESGEDERDEIDEDEHALSSSEEEEADVAAAAAAAADDITDNEQQDIPGRSPLRRPSIASPRRRRASTRLIAQNAADIQRITGESTTQLISRCCGGGCCLKADAKVEGVDYEEVPLPDNDAFRSLQLKIGGIPTKLTSVADIPEQTTFFLPLHARSSSPPAPPAGVPEAAATPPASAAVITPTAPPTEASSAPSSQASTNSLPTTPTKPTETASIPDSAVSMGDSSTDDGYDLDTTIQPPFFVQPHPPYHVFPARIHNARELTGAGAEKRTYHFDLDVTDYPAEGDNDFRVGGAIGVVAPNDDALVDSLLDLLMVPRFLRDKPVLLRTTKGRWPTVWGDDQARELVTTRRDLLRWCTDVQSYPPTKALLRLLAEHAADENERKVLMFLCSGEGQGVFCDFRTGPHVSLEQILHAFPSAKPPLDHLLSILQQQMPRFYSLSNDPHDSKTHDSKTHGDDAGRAEPTRRVIEIAVTVHETSDWLRGTRTGIGSGFFERQALRFLEARKRGEAEPDLYVPMFKGLMANPLAKQFVPDGPMLLIGAGVGIAPFRGFVQRRLKTANCANKVWVLQGIRDSLVDELYSGEWGVHEDEVKRVVESRRGTGRYVQEEVRNQADLVWYVINSVDGRVFVCGSTRGMGEGVHQALVDVAMQKGNLGHDEAGKFWDLKREAGQYIAETW